jgi:hypothetical protein
MNLIKEVFFVWGYSHRKAVQVFREVSGAGVKKQKSDPPNSLPLYSFMRKDILK